MSINSRQSFIEKMDILDSPKSKVLDCITELASKTFKLPISTVSIVDENRIWFKSVFGINLKQLTLEDGLCASVVKGNKPLVIEDTTEDALAKENSIVKNKPNIRFYAGIPIKIGDFNIGALTLLDFKPRVFSESDKKQFIRFAALVKLQLEQEYKLLDMSKTNKETVKHFSQFLDSSSEIICYVDTELKIRFINRAGIKMCESIFGKTPGIGDNSLDFLLPNNHLKFHTYTQEGLHGKSFSKELRIKEHYFNFNISPVKDDSNEIIGLVYVISNITERFQHKQVLNQKNQELNAIAWKQAHEVRKPLANILGIIDLLDRNKKNQPSSFLIEKLTQSAMMLDSVIHQVVRDSERYSGEG